MNVIPQSKSFSKTSPPIKANNKELINQISSLISIELSRIDTEDIHNEFNSLFPYQTTTQSSYITSLTSTISNLKQSTISSVSNFLSCYTFPNSSNNNYIAKEEEYITMIFSINTEIKNLIKQSKIKFKQNKDFSSALGFNINVIGENIQNGKIDLAMERIVKIDEIKNEIEKNLIYIEEYQNKFYDNVKNIIKNTTNDFPKMKQEQSPLPTQNNLSTIKKTSYMTYSSNGKKLNKSVNHYKSKSKDPKQQAPSNEEIINVLRNKNKELSKEISLLKKRIKNEQDSKSQIQNELITLKQKHFSASKTIGYSGEKSMSNITTDLKLDNLNKRIKSLSDMILTFSLSMNNLRDSLIRKNISVIDIQSDYKNLKKQLLYLSSTAVSLKSKIEKKNEDYNTMKTYDSSSNIKKCSEFNNISSIMDASGEFSTSYNNGNTNNDTLSKVIENAKQKEIEDDDDEDDNSSNDINNNLKQLSNIVITFRNDENNIQKEHQPPLINIENNNDSPIREESNINIEELINENKNLKSQLASQLLLNSSQTEIEQLKSELSMAEAKIKELNMSNSMIANQNKEKIIDSVLKKELFELKAKNEKIIKETNEIIEKKNKEIEELKTKNQNNNENVFKNLIENYNNNLVNIKQSYEEVISDKNKKIDELNMEIIALNEKINEINAMLYNSQNEKRTQNIIKEASMSNLENEKISLQITIEQLQKEIEKYKNQTSINNTSSNEKTMMLSSQIENLNFKIKTLNSLIESKEKIIQSLQSKKEEDSKSNSSMISQMDTKIKSLQSEILNKVNTINELKKESNDKTKQIDLLTQNYQNDLNELNTSVILLKSKISKLQEENISLSYRQRNTISLCSIHHIIDFSFLKEETKQKEIDKLKKEISTLKSQLNDDSSSTRTDHQNLSMRNNDNNNSVTRTSTDKEFNSNRQLTKQKEELTVLKAKLRSTLDENKILSTKVNELEFAAKKEKDEYMTVLRSAFEKFLNETQITQKNKEFTTILLKMMNYTDDDINDILTNISKKKEKVTSGVFSFLRK